MTTNLEIYWDRIATAIERGDGASSKGEGEGRPGGGAGKDVSMPGGAGSRLASDPAASAMRVTTVRPSTAELRIRGFSDVSRADAFSPELPDYNRVSRGPRWRDLIGFYTRPGDVRELLAAVDDRYVIMNAGDEFVLRFPAPAPPRAGWVRDFVFVSDGWVKDGDLNTVASKTVNPLPSHARTLYLPTPARLEDDPVYRRHRADWTRYHTRYVDARAFRDLLRGRR
jgi:hypothetical protein